MMIRPLTQRDAPALQRFLVRHSGSAESERQAALFIDEQLADGSAWLAEVAGAPVAFSGFNARLPDIVQLGGIYTPPELRGRGHAKCAVAGALLAAREIGVRRAVLFTQNPSALRCYVALGFARVGSYSLVLLR